MLFHNALAVIVRKIRRIVLPSYYGNAQAIRQKSHLPVDAVTQLDLDVEDFLTIELDKAFPGIPFVGEERGGNRDADQFWLCDPIDGTGYFMRGMPFCTTMLALIQNGNVICSVIYDFVNDVLYFAERGLGASANGETIRVSNRSLRESYGGWEIRLDELRNRNIFDRLRKRCLLGKTFASGYEYAMVAQGKLDFRITLDPHGKDYDFAPGALLVAEAGGVVANLGSSDYDYQKLNFIAANPVIYRELTEGPDAIFPIRENT